MALVCGLAAASALMSACGGASPDQVRTAQNSGYDTDFAIVYREALAVVRRSYPHVTEDANAGVIKTAWHPVRVNSSGGPSPSQRSDPSISPMLQAGAPVYRYYIRFDIRVVGGNPWRVRVIGQASELDESGIPRPLKGGNEPPWLQGRIDALQVEIHSRLERHAVALRSTRRDAAPAPVNTAPEVDVSALGPMPPGAAEVVAEVLRAARARDFEALGATMRSEFTWSLGAPPSAEQALVMWQADATLLAQLVAAIEAGCATDPGGERVTCPRASAEQPGDPGYRAGFEPGRDGDGGWKMVFFVSGE